MNWNELITDDFNTMHDMLKDIEIKIMGVDQMTQFEFYKPIKNMIFEAWQDACNKEDSFLYPKQ